MRYAYVIVSLALLVPASAEQPQRCGGGRTVDDYLADIAKAEKKKKRERNKNPLPDSVCVWGWCRHKTPSGPFPDPPSVDSKVPSEPKSDQKVPEPPPGESTSKRPVEEVATPAQAENTSDCDPLRAAKDVEVGDYYYGEKSYKGALMRYKLAVESWPNEPNILFRVAKTYEGMQDADRAGEYYTRVIEADRDAPIAKEAQAALARLKKTTATSPVEK